MLLFAFQTSTLKERISQAFFNSRLTRSFDSLRIQFGEGINILIYMLRRIFEHISDIFVNFLLLENETACAVGLSHLQTTPDFALEVFF